MINSVKKQEIYHFHSNGLFPVFIIDERLENISNL